MAPPARWHFPRWPELPVTPDGRWFRAGLRFFAAGAVVAALAASLLWVPQLRVLAAVALVQGLLGAALCAWGASTTGRPPG